MIFIKYLPITILLFFTLKFLISYIEKSTISINKKIIKKQIEFGILSIKDIQKNNYNTFIKIINLYIDILGFKDKLSLPNEYSNLTNFKASLNNEDVFISCIQNDLLKDTSADEDKWELIDSPDVQSFLARMVINDCKKGIIITNSSFSNEAIKFINNFNNKKINIRIIILNAAISALILNPSVFYVRVWNVSRV